MPECGTSKRHKQTLYKNHAKLLNSNIVDDRTPSVFIMYGFDFLLLLLIDLFVCAIFSSFAHGGDGGGAVIEDGSGSHCWSDGDPPQHQPSKSVSAVVNLRYDWAGVTRWIDHVARRVVLEMTLEWRLCSFRLLQQMLWGYQWSCVSILGGKRRIVGCAQQKLVCRAERVWLDWPNLCHFEKRCWVFFLTVLPMCDIFLLVFGHPNPIPSATWPTRYRTVCAPLPVETRKIWNCQSWTNQSFGFLPYEPAFVTPVIQCIYGIYGIAFVWKASRLGAMFSSKSEIILGKQSKSHETKKMKPKALF